MPYTDTNVNNLIINKLTKAKFEELKDSGQINANEYYYVKDDNTYALKTDLFSKDYNELINKPTIPSISVSETGTSEVEAKYLTVNNTEYKLGGGSGENQYEMAILQNSINNTTKEKEYTYTSSNVIYYSIFAQGGNGATSSQIPAGFVPSASWSNRAIRLPGNDGPEIKVIACSDTSITLKVATTNTTFAVFAFRKI